MVRGHQKPTFLPTLPPPPPLHIHTCIMLWLLGAQFSFFRKVYNALFGCYTLYRPVADTGFEFPNKQLAKKLVSKRDILNDVRRRKKAGDLPPVYPNGWFSLIRSEEVAVGASTSVNALGENFAVFRDTGGKVHILDAYCAHLGANLAVGGRVCGYTLQASVP